MIPLVATASVASPVWSAPGWLFASPDLPARPGSPRGPRLVVVAVALLLALVSIPAFAQSKRPAAGPPSVVVAAVERRDVTPHLSYVGRIEAVDTVDLVARVEGFLEQRNFREGGYVEKGELLFLIEQAPYRIAVEQRRADLAGAQASLDAAAEDFARKETLVKRGSVARSALDEARAALGIARAAVQQAQAALRRVQLDLAYTEVASPIAGRIGRAAFSVGAFVRPSDGALATVTSTDPIHVVIAVTERELLNVRREGFDLDNPRVTPSLRLSDGSVHEHPGKFDFLAPSVDRATDTLLVRAIFPNPEGLLLPGQFVTVIVRLNEPVSALVIPQAAVQEDQQGHFVLVVDRADRVAHRRVVLGERDGGIWQVVDGLAEGERIIVQGLQKVRPDVVVNPVEGRG